MDLEKELTKLERYLLKQGREELVIQLKKLSNEDRKNRLMGQAVHEQEIFDTKEKESETSDIQKAKSVIKEFNSTYNEQLKMCRKISRFIHLLIEDSNKND